MLWQTLTVYVRGPHLVLLVRFVDGPLNLTISTTSRGLGHLEDPDCASSEVSPPAGMNGRHSRQLPA